MDNNTSRTHLTTPPHYDSVRNGYDGVWEQYGQYDFSSSDAPPSQVPPFFQTSQGPLPSDGRYGETPTAQAFSSMPISIPQYAFTNIPSQTHPSSSKRPRGRPPKTSKVEPYSKRQKVSTEPFTSNQTPATCAGQDECSSVSQSSCCSSCSEGIPCAAPDCDAQRIAVVPCTKQGCEQPVCTSPCLPAAIQNQQIELDPGTVPPSSRLSAWDNSAWNPEAPRASTQMNTDSPESLIDPALMAFDGPEYGYTSPAPKTPHLEDNNISTPYSPNNALPTPQFSSYHPQSTYASDSAAILSGTGTWSDPSVGQWQNQSFDTSNTGSGFSMFNCPWDGCQQPFPSQQDWIPHLHRDHVDPQMTFGCPLQGETCPPTIGSNPLDHLEADHGYHFDINSGGFSCPAPACPPGETFCNPAMLHNHFDHAHATPAHGSLRCQLDTCNTIFEGPQKLFAHINEHHQFLAPISNEGDIDLNSHGETVKLANNMSNAESSNEERPHACRWKNDDGFFCGLVCKSEDELQTHVKNEHLAHMGGKSGYVCQWEGCKRLEKRGDKLGFSQRGKLERHMSTHTGCKYRCSVFDHMS
jgi:hypothetical protein